MTTIAVIAAVVLAVALLARLTRGVIATDGYGRSTRPPASHHADVFERPHPAR